MASGTLFLIPVPLGPVSPDACLPPDTLAVARRLDTFVVERAKTARAHLKAMGHPLPIQSLKIEELNEHTPAATIPPLLAPLKAGHDVGLLSEAGCPAVADPGAALVLAAHRENIPVVPLIGPSSILLALMASGLGGQRFAFHGYLPAKEPERSQAIRELEKTARQDFVALALLYWCINQPRRVGLLIAFLLGLAMDVADGALMGQHALAYTLLAYASIALHRRIQRFAMKFQVLHVLVQLFACDLVVLLSRGLAGADFPGALYFAGAPVGAALWPAVSHYFKLPQRPRSDPDQI